MSTGHSGWLPITFAFNALISFSLAYVSVCDPVESDVVVSVARLQLGKRTIDIRLGCKWTHTRLGALPIGTRGST